MSVKLSEVKNAGKMEGKEGEETGRRGREGGKYGEKNNYAVLFS